MAKFKDPSPALNGPPTMTIYGGRFEAPQVDSPNFNLPQTVNTLDVNAAAAAANTATSTGVNTNLALAQSANAPSLGTNLSKVGEIAAAAGGLAALGFALSSAIDDEDEEDVNGLETNLNAGGSNLQLGVGVSGINNGAGFSGINLNNIVNANVSAGAGVSAPGVNAGVNTGVGVNAGVGGVGVNAGINTGVNANLGGLNVGIGGSVNNAIGTLAGGVSLVSNCGVNAAINSGVIPGINAGINANVGLNLPNLSVGGGLNLNNLRLGTRLKFDAPCIRVDGVGQFWFPDKYPPSKLFGKFTLPNLGTVLNGNQINLGINTGVNFGVNFNTDLYNFAGKVGVPFSLNGINIGGSAAGALGGIAGALGVNANIDLSCLTGFDPCKRIQAAASKLKSVRVGMQTPKVPLPVVEARTKNEKVTTNRRSPALNDLLNSSNLQRA